ncbi:hypothetical protein VPH35_051555 [Triticum aestivum]
MDRGARARGRQRSVTFPRKRGTKQLGHVLRWSILTTWRGAGAVLISPTQDKLYYAVQLCFQQNEKVSNNIVEYEGLIAGLKAAAALGLKHLVIKGDSQLLLNFSNKVYEPKDEHMEAYLAEFTKWAEVEAVHTIPAGSAVNFIKGLVSQFEVPNCIITDNGSQFTSNLFKTYCANLGTQICYASVAHPRRNGQAERANAEVLKGLKTRTFKKKLEACGRGWYDELQSVLWSIRTTTTKSIVETPFFLVYGAEAVLPHEVRRRSARVLAFDEAHQGAMRGMDLVLGEEHRREATLRAARYQQELRWYHCRNIRLWTLEVGDLMLRRVISREGLHKLSPMWEGPLKFVHVSRPGATRLETQEGVPILNAWNIQHLRRFYP